jgi:hypothetical protein
MKTITNPFGDTEKICCAKEKGHLGGHRYTESYDEFGEDAKQVRSKVKTMAYMTAGATAANTPITNRGSRFAPPRALTKTEELELKAAGVYKVGIRKDEASTFEQCKKIEIDLRQDALDSYTGKGYDCPLCGLPMLWEHFLSKDLKNGKSVHGCHLDPLEEGSIKHYVENIKWGHRNCNSIQGDRSLDQLQDHLRIMYDHLQKGTNEGRKVNQPTISW